MILHSAVCGGGGMLSVYGCMDVCVRTYVLGGV